MPKLPPGFCPGFNGRSDFILPFSTATQLYRVNFSPSNTLAFITANLWNPANIALSGVYDIFIGLAPLI